MKKTFKYIFLLTVAIPALSGCNYLDIVPDNTVTITSAYENKAKAWGALAGCYYYIPNPSYDRWTLALAGGEYTTIYTSAYLNDPTFAQGEKMILGQNSAASPMFDYWCGASGNCASLYQGIRFCNIFLENIDSVPDLSVADKADWKAQVTVLKAYYHFYLTQLYGPIVLVENNLGPNDPNEQLWQERQPVDKCIDYIVSLIDKALPVLPESRAAAFLGQIDRTVAASIKAKVLLVAASPLFNGNTEYYSTFKNKAGEALISQVYDKEKWKRALDAADEAIQLAEKSGRSLYTYTGQPYKYDQSNWEMSEIIKPAYNTRMSIVDPWNSELAWGYSFLYKDMTMQIACQMADALGTANFSWNFLGANFSMLEFFYTRNGVCIDEDRTFDYYGRMNIVASPSDSYHTGYVQRNYRTLNLTLNREPRYYAWIGTDGSIWRDYNRLNNMQMRYGQDNGIQKISSPHNRFYGGIVIKKWVHPESKNENVNQYVHYPLPLIRMADLYLAYAEASNEYYGPNDDALEKINAVRARAGLRAVEDVYSDPTVVYETGKHQTKEGFRSIIQRERMIELCFEDQRYHDLRRWKLAHKYLSGPVQGFDIEKSAPEEYYSLVTRATMKFVTPRDYLFPIRTDELNINPNLLQNPGW